MTMRSEGEYRAAIACANFSASAFVYRVHEAQIESLESELAVLREQLDDYERLVG